MSVLLFPNPSPGNSNTGSLSISEEQEAEGRSSLFQELDESYEIVIRIIFDIYSSFVCVSAD